MQMLELLKLHSRTPLGIDVESFAMLLENKNATHRTLMDALEFKIPPSKAGMWGGDPHYFAFLATQHPKADEEVLAKAIHHPDPAIVLSALENAKATPQLQAAAAQYHPAKDVVEAIALFDLFPKEVREIAKKRLAGWKP